MKDFYQILGVSRTASQDEIKKAFRTLAHQHHPDKEGGNDAKFKEINEAYQTLSNADKRRHYNQFGQAPNAGGAGRGGNPFGGGFQSGGFNVNFEDLGDLGDVFGSFFGGQARGGRQARGADLESELTIEFTEAVFGVEKAINIHKKTACAKCSGSGAEPGSKTSTCNTCKGQGRIMQIQQTVFGNFQNQTICPDCRGEGSKVEQVCSQCRGQGVSAGSEQIKVKVPAGIDDGQSLKLSGRGDAFKKGPSGDLYIHIRIKKSKSFEREGTTIRSTEHINIKQAMLGAEIMVETVDGQVKLQIPAGTQSHSEFKLRDKGVVQLGGSRRGDQIVKIIVDIPRSLSRGQKQALENF